MDRVVVFGNSVRLRSAFRTCRSRQPRRTHRSITLLIHSISGELHSRSYLYHTSQREWRTFVVSYSDAAIIVYDTRSGEEIASMASLGRTMEPWLPASTQS